jgi:Cu(I)/Ag(I) efflux system membrane protein CusA/SilA
MLGAVERVRPKMMTVVAIMAGLVPILWSTGAGSEVMQRIAVPMIGGMISSTILTLVVIPAIYGIIKGWRLPAKAGRTAAPRDRLPEHVSGDLDSCRQPAMTSTPPTSSR